MPRALLTRLRQPGVLIYDGATGTMLQTMGMRPPATPELWVLNEPDKIRALHQTYLDAGADLLLTCTFGGSPIRLADSGLDLNVAEVNRRAAELAREVAGERAFVAGDIGPTGQLMMPMGPLTPEKARRAFSVQAAALAEGGADLIQVETMGDLAEATAAVEAAREATDLPIFATMSFEAHGRTMMGVQPAQAAQALLAAGATAVGVNCGRSLEEAEEAIREMRQAAPDAILIAKPNAGVPKLVDRRPVYDVGPEEFAAFARRFAEAGVKVIGGCCGTTPAHIAAVVKELRGTVSRSSAAGCDPGSAACARGAAW